MNEVIKNTLHIISKLSHSNCGYLLDINFYETKIFSIWGEREEVFDEFNSELFELYKANRMSSELISQLLSFQNLKSNLSFNSFYTEEVHSIKESNESVYLLLFSEQHSQFNEECKDKITSVINILSSQVKDELLNINKSLLETSSVENNISDETETDLVFSDWENIFNCFLEASVDMIFLLDKSGCFVTISESTKDLLDYSLKDLKGKHFTEIIDVDYTLKAISAIDQTLKSRNTVKAELELVSKYERNIPFEINCRTISKEGKILGLLGTARNVNIQKNFESEIKKLKPQIIEAKRIIQVERSRSRHHKSLIEELNRLKSEFVSNISHEFRTPLASIIGFSETIESDPDLPLEMKKEFNRVILNEGKRLAKLINDVLDLSKVDGGHVKLDKSHFAANELLKEVIASQMEFADRKQITITFEPAKEDDGIEADREKLKKAFEALVNNAIKFTNEYGRIKVICTSLFRELEFVISDTGIGIPEKDLPYIFQKFFRVSRPGAELPGSGIGLVFVKQIVDLHKGLINAQSELASGTTFVLKLPKSSKIERTED